MLKSVMLVLMLACTLRAEDATPIDQTIPEAKVTRIACELTEAMAPKNFQGSAGTIIPGIYHYDVYLPRGYHGTENAYPCVVVASPVGNAKIDQIREFVEEAGWIAIMLVESKNGDRELRDSNIIAAHDDMLARLRIIKGLIVVTGPSGGGWVACLWGMNFPEVGGIIPQSSPKHLQSRLQPMVQKGLLVYALYGDKEYNRLVLPEIYDLGVVNEYKTVTGRLFRGGHQPSPKVEVRRALDWFVYTSLVETMKIWPRSYSVSSVQRYIKKIRLADEKIDRYILLDQLNDIVTKQELADDPVVKPLWAECATEYRKLKENTMVQDEWKLLKAFEGVEIKAMRNIASMERTEADEANRKLYADFVKNYKGTRVEAKAKACVAENSL